MEAFRPENPECVSLYVCGPTVYNFIHVGNARSAVVFDLLYRILSFFFPKVLYVRNITDVDDKINDAARQCGISLSEFTHKTIEYFHEDMRALGVYPPTVEPKATEHIDKMISMIETLVHKGLAYVAEEHVLFHSAACPSYGALSGMPLEDMKAGARVEVAPYKRHGCDFVLWKPSAPEEVGWESPWGRGRPGWHIECSAMSTTYLGETFDIHGGGYDLLFPHHENEHTQTCGVTGRHKSATYWLHNGMLLVGGKKMSKSLGNFITVRDALTKIPGEVMRWVLLSAHYRHTLDWTPELLEQATTCVNALYHFFRYREDFAPVSLEDIPSLRLHGPFLEALADDMNTPKALRALQHLACMAQKNPHKPDLQEELWDSCRFLGIIHRPPHQWFQGTVDAAFIEKVIAERNHARAMKDYAKADELRAMLVEKGILLEDNPDGTTFWRHLSSGFCEGL